jgi:hypothetical protein
MKHTPASSKGVAFIIREAGALSKRERMRAVRFILRSVSFDALDLGEAGVDAIENDASTALLILDKRIIR